MVSLGVGSWQAGERRAGGGGAASASAGGRYAASAAVLPLRAPPHPSLSLLPPMRLMGVSPHLDDPAHLAALEHSGWERGAQRGWLGSGVRVVELAPRERRQFEGPSGAFQQAPISATEAFQLYLTLPLNNQHTDSLLRGQLK